MRKLRVIAAALVAALCLSACGSKSAASASADASKDLKQLDVVLDWYPNAVHTFLYEAQVRGYFAEEGIEVNLISPAESVDAITFVAAGKAQIGLTYPIDTILAYANEDMPVMGIGAISQEALGCMTSLASNDINADFSSLKGKKIGYSGTGAAKAEIDTITAGAGLTEGDYELLNVGFDLTTSLTTENVDLVVGTFINDECVTMAMNGYEINIWKYQDYGVPPMYGLIMVANSESMSADPELYNGFLRACKKGFDDMKADPDAAMGIIMTQMNSDDNPLDEDQQDGSYRILIPLMEPENTPFLTMTAEVWQETIDWMADSGLIEASFDANEVFTSPAV